jgi:hypothetical protein
MPGSNSGCSGTTRLRMPRERGERAKSWGFGGIGPYSGFPESGLVVKLVWRVKLVAEVSPGVVTETEVGRIERDEEVRYRCPANPPEISPEWVSFRLPQPQARIQQDNGNCSPGYDLYPAHAIIRNSVGVMTRKLSVTSSQYSPQFLGTSSRRKVSIAVLNCLKVA